MAVDVLGKQVRTTLAERLVPTRSAVLVVDVQNEYCRANGKFGDRVDVSAISSILSPLARLLDDCRSAGVTIVYIQMTMAADGRYSSPADLARRTKFLGVESPMATIQGTWGHEVVEAIAPQPGDLVVQKHRNNAFIGTDLDMQLRARGVETVVVTGLATQACVLETALAAQGFDYYVALATDCCAASTPELQSAAIAVMEAVLHPEAIVTSSQVMDALRERQHSV